MNSVMKSLLGSALCFGGVCMAGQPPTRIFSDRPAANWEHATLSGNGELGVMTLGEPYDDTLFLSHSDLFLPYPNSGTFPDFAAAMPEVKKLCLEGKFAAAGNIIDRERKKNGYHDRPGSCKRDPFIGACRLKIVQAGKDAKEYRRFTDFMTGETGVEFRDGLGAVKRSCFVSRPGNFIAVRLDGTEKRTTRLILNGIPPTGKEEKRMIDEGVKSIESGVKDGLLYFRMLFRSGNESNPLTGVEAAAKVVTDGGTSVIEGNALRCDNARSITLHIRIRPLLKSDGTDSRFDLLKQELAAIPADYDSQLAAHAAIHGERMGRVSLDLDAPAAERALSTDALNAKARKVPESPALTERAFLAGRYNIISASGKNPPNLQGLWAGSWAAAWYGSYTTNGNLPCAVAFGNMGNTPEVMEPFFRWFEARLPGFRRNAKESFGTRGFHVPAQLTVSPRSTDFSPGYPHLWWYAGAAWICSHYYDYYQYTGDREFLARRAYPLLKETAEFYEDLLTETDAKGHWLFVPSYSPENRPGNSRETAINATMEISAAKQLLRHAIAAAETLKTDAPERRKWMRMLEKFPPYEVAPDGSFREWLYPGLEENNEHRHASHFYALYDEAPPEIVENPQLAEAVRRTIRRRMDFNMQRSRTMAFGYIQNGLAACRIGDAEQVREIVNFINRGNWSNGMGSFHDRGHIFNTDLSGGYPYLIASALVYSEPGAVRLFPARPLTWRKGTLRGVKLRGNLLLEELSWSDGHGRVILLPGQDGRVTVSFPDGSKRELELTANRKIELKF